jgi:tight adherence protein C
MLIAGAGSAAAFVAVVAALLWAGASRRAAAEARLLRLAPSSGPASLDAPFSERVMIPVIGSVVGFIVALLPPAFVARISRQLVSAGRPMSVSAFFTTVALTAAGFPAALLVFAALNKEGGPGVLAILLTAFAAWIGLLLPFVLLRRAVRQRKTAVWKSLPDAFDLVTVSVEAGLGLDAALRQVAEKLRGPLADEIAQTLREVGMGRPRREALEEMAERIDVKEVGTFVNAVIQAEHLGTSLGRVLRAQSASLRIRRRQRAEELSRKAPVKLVFPLVLFIMPTFFIVTLGPIVVHLVDYLEG